MKRADRELGVLALAAAALVAAVLWTGRIEYLRDPPALTTLDPAAITHVEITIPPLARQAFERRRDGWWRIRPSLARADGARIAQLAKLAATPVARWLPASASSTALGLSPPSATLTLDGKRLAYGGLSAIGELRYVAIGTHIALVPRQYSPEVALTKPQR
ncbi:MAG TPA: hypothetical protein VFQ95_07470 [Rhodanobacteraceae bacterium]|nr:hypothetical protein [Rhodanobacteraceae bacterium]